MSGPLTIDQSNSGTTLYNSDLVLGNNITEGTTGCTRGVIRLYGRGQYKTALFPEAISAERYITIPDKSGTMAITDDITDAANRLMAFYSIPFDATGSTLRLKVKMPFRQYSRMWFMFLSIAGGQPSIQFVHAHTENYVPQANIYNILKTHDNYTYTVDSVTLDSNNYMEILFKRPSDSYDSMQIVTTNPWCNFGHTFS